ncbi:MAG: endonuclease V [Pirellulales bacterium]|nr:endonuclease V [Pirellulales bacterium]
MSALLPEIPDLFAHLERLWAQIPPGRVTTYGDVADALGDRVAARWVGHVAMHHDHAAACPCHRLVRADGQLGLYVAGTAETKARRLRAEGVAVRAGAVDLAPWRFDQFQSDRPLEALRQAQESLAKKAILRGRRNVPKRIGGVDVSYAANGDAVAAYVLVETESGAVVWSTTLRRPVRFPYITSYLAFRELPVLLELVESVRTAGRGCDVLLVDGTGALHPRRGGIAMHLGVLADQATIGLTKKLLCGRVDRADMTPGEPRPVWLGDEPLGVAVRATSGSRRPLFVSPGHRADVPLAKAVVLATLRGRRLPEPLYWADRLSRAAARR